MDQQFMVSAVDPASLALFLEPSGFKDSTLLMLWYWAAIYPRLAQRPEAMRLQFA